MPLPNTGMDFTALDTLAAAELDDLVENIEALAAGTGLNNAVITPSKWTNPYKFHAWKNDAQNTSNGAYVKVTFDTESFDSNNNFASSTYTIPVTGFYMFFARVKVPTNSLGQLAIYKNGAEYKKGTELAYTADRMGMNICFMDSFTATNTIDVYVYDNSSSAITTGQSETYFGGYLISLT